MPEVRQTRLQIRTQFGCDWIRDMARVVALVNKNSDKVFEKNCSKTHALEAKLERSSISCSDPASAYAIKAYNTEHSDISSIVSFSRCSMLLMLRFQNKARFEDWGSKRGQKNKRTTRVHEKLEMENAQLIVQATHAQNERFESSIICGAYRHFFDNRYSGANFVAVQHCVFEFEKHGFDLIRPQARKCIHVGCFGKQRISNGSTLAETVLNEKRA
jgi:hypothetical protein